MNIRSRKGSGWYICVGVRSHTLEYLCVLFIWLVVQKGLCNVVFAFGSILAEHGIGT